MNPNERSTPGFNNAVPLQPIPQENQQIPLHENLIGPPDTEQLDPIEKVAAWNQYNEGTIPVEPHQEDVLPLQHASIENNDHPLNHMHMSGHLGHPAVPEPPPGYPVHPGYHGNQNYAAARGMPQHAYMGPPPQNRSVSHENVNAMPTPSFRDVELPEIPAEVPAVRKPECNYTLLKTLAGHKKSIAVVKFSPDGLYLGTASADKEIKLWTVKDFRCEKTLLGHKLGVNDIGWSSNSQLVVSGSDDTTVKIFAISTEACLTTLKGHTSYVFCCSFNPQCSLIASGSYDDTIRLWNIVTGKCIMVIPAHSDPVTSLSFNRDGRFLATSSYDGCIRVWDVSNGACLKTLADVDHSPITFVEFTPNGKFLISSQLDSTVKLWELASEKPLRYYIGHENSKYCIFAHLTVPHGIRIISGSEDGKVFVWDLQSKTVLQVLDSHKTPVLATDTHPTLNIMASGGLEPDHVIRIWRSDK